MSEVSLSQINKVPSVLILLSGVSVRGQRSGVRGSGLVVGLGVSGRVGARPYFEQGVLLAL